MSPTRRVLCLAFLPHEPVAVQAVYRSIRRKTFHQPPLRHRDFFRAAPSRPPQPKHDSHSDAIRHFEGDFECLSNTYKCLVSLRGDPEPYPSVEVRVTPLHLTSYNVNSCRELCELEYEGSHKSGRCVGSRLLPKTSRAKGRTYTAVTDVRSVSCFARKIIPSLLLAAANETTNKSWVDARGYHYAMRTLHGRVLCLCAFFTTLMPFLLAALNECLEQHALQASKTDDSELKSTIRQAKNAIEAKKLARVVKVGL